MKWNSDRYKKFAASPDDEIADETSTTRLFAYDLAEVKAMCVGGKKKSDVIRELVRRALYSRRYRQASTDPAFKEILKAFDERMGVRIHHLEERLTHRMEMDFQTLLGLVGYLYVAENFMLGELKGVSLSLEPEQVTEEMFLEAWQARMETMKKSAWAEVRRRLGERNQQLQVAKQPDEPEDDRENP